MVRCHKRLWDPGSGVARLAEGKNVIVLSILRMFSPDGLGCSDSLALLASCRNVAVTVSSGASFRVCDKGSRRV